MPESPSACIGCLRGSQPLKSPTTATETAFGAHTAKEVASPMKCAPIFSYRRLCVPSRKRYLSCPGRGTAGRSVTAGLGAIYLTHLSQKAGGLLPFSPINFDYADCLRSALSVEKPRHPRRPAGLY